MIIKKIQFFLYLSFIISLNGFANESNDFYVPSCRETTFALDKSKQITFLWFSGERAILDEKNLQNAINLGDPLRLVELLYRLEYYGCQNLESGKDSRPYFEQSKKIVDFLISDYQPAVRNKTSLLLKYKNSHNQIAAGWWSCMDGFLLPLILHNSYLIFGDDRYRHEAIKAFNAISQSVQSLGSVLNIDSDPNEAWLSEYAWKNMTESDEYYVLNGHLYALQALKLYADLTKDKKAISLYAAALKGARNKINQFNELPNWFYYMLNKKTINQTHYVIFEKIQFESLYALTLDPFFKEQALIRADRLKLNTHISKEKEGNNYKITLLRASPPHPYNIDMYRTKLKCYSDNDQVVIEIFSLKQEQQFLVANSYTEPKKCDVYAYTDLDLSEIIFSTSDFSASANLWELIPDFTVKYDAIKKSERDFEVDPNLAEKDRGELNINIHNDNFGQVNGLFGFDMDVSESVNFGVVITDSLGKEFFRYYPALEIGHNLVILSPLGFNQVEEAILPFKKIDLHIYTHNKNKLIYGRIGHLFFSSDANALNDYIKKLEPIYVPHEAH